MNDEFEGQVPNDDNIYARLGDIRVSLYMDLNPKYVASSDMTIVYYIPANVKEMGGLIRAFRMFNVVSFEVINTDIVDEIQWHIDSKEKYDKAVENTFSSMKVRNPNHTLIYYGEVNDGMITISKGKVEAIICQN